MNPLEAGLYLEVLFQRISVDGDHPSTFLRYLPSSTSALDGFVCKEKKTVIPMI